MRAADLKWLVSAPQTLAIACCAGIAGSIGQPSQQGWQAAGETFPSSHANSQTASCIRGVACALCVPISNDVVHAQSAHSVRYCTVEVGVRAQNWNRRCRICCYFCFVNPQARRSINHYVLFLATLPDTESLVCYILNGDISMTSDPRS